MIGFVRDERGWCIESHWITFHPHSYGIATLMRFAVGLPGGGKLTLHHFRPHVEEEFHDHPWSFRTRVLWGSYTDEALLPGGQIVRDVLRRGDTRSRPALHAHRTSCTRQTWTLVLMSPKERSWCKGSPERWVCGGRIEDFDATRGMVKIG